MIELSSCLDGVFEMEERMKLWSIIYIRGDVQRRTGPPRRAKPSACFVRSGVQSRVSFRDAANHGLAS